MTKIRISGNYWDSLRMNVIPFALFFTLLTLVININYFHIVRLAMVFLVFGGMLTLVDFGTIYFEKFKTLYVSDNGLIIGDDAVALSDVKRIISTKTISGWKKEIWFIELTHEQEPVKILAKPSSIIFFFKYRSFDTKSMKELLSYFPALQEKVVFFENSYAYRKSL